MQGAPTSFWGKLQKADDGVVQAWHPLEHHCADVAACAKALLTHSILKERIARSGGLETLDETTVARISVLAAFHDLGKYNHGFQNKREASPTWVAGHVTEGVQLLLARGRHQERAHDAIEWNTLASWGDGDAAIALLIACIAHHGRPPSDLRTTPDPRLWDPHNGVTPMQGLAELAQATRRWLPAAHEDQASGRLPAAPAFQHCVAGLVMLADWLGSDQRFFEYSTRIDGDRFAQSELAARDALKHMGVDCRPARSGLGRVGFSSISPHPEPRAAQRQVASLPTPGDASVTVLEAETGSGKTEAAIWRYLQLFQAGRVDGMYFALPTRTAATQVYRRVVEALARAFPNGDQRPPCVLAVPGYLNVDGQEGQRLPHFSVLWPDDEDARFRYRAWASEHPKRYLLGAVVVGTIDQALLSVLRVAHAHMRQTALLRHLLVIDEVHASDAYMSGLTEVLLARQQACGGHALLMSATLGAAAREPLLGVARLTLCAAREVPYPAITHAELDGEPRITRVASAGNPKRFQVACHELMDNPDAVADRALAAARQGARVLVIRNTVADCVATQRATEGLAGAGGRGLLMKVGDRAVPHHSRYASIDRRVLDLTVERTLSPTHGRDGCVVIATQTVQQSLDLDADYLLTDLCPMDVLLQRMGRLHRHQRARPHGYQDACCDVLVPADSIEAYLRPDGTAVGPHGLGTVYEDAAILQATWSAILRSPRIAVPDDCRGLVEQTTHPEALDALAQARGGAWSHHRNHMFGVRAAHRRKADLHRVDWDIPYYDCGFPGGLEERVSTRLGEDDRRLVFERPLRSPLGAEFCEVSIPAFLARGLGTECEPTVTATTEDEIYFDVGTVGFRYTRLGLERMEGDRT